MKNRSEAGQFIKGHTTNIGRNWTEEQLDYIKKTYPYLSNKEISNKIGKKPELIMSMGNKFGLRKTKNTMSKTLRDALKGKCPRGSGFTSHRKGLTTEEEYGKKRAEEIRIKASSSRIGIHPNRVYNNPPRYWQGKKLPLEIRNKISETLRGGASSFFKFKDHPEWRARNLKSCMKKPTKPEFRLIKICLKYGLPFKYTGNGEKIIGSVNPDFIHNWDNKVIEVFGRAFHDPEVTFKDSIPWHQQYEGRISYYSERGYDCLIFWDDNLRKMTDFEVAEKIQEKWP